MGAQEGAESFIDCREHGASTGQAVQNEDQSRLLECNVKVRAATLRIGIVDYLNSRPLAWSFLGDKSIEGVDPHFLSPAHVADGLASGELDVGLVPTIELQRIPGLAVIPGLCVAATEEVRSVLLLSRVPPSEIRRLALDENSRTSVTLAKILLHSRYGVDPQPSSVSPDPETMLETSEAALLIGDPALRVDRRRYRILDLAAEWRQLTGKPFVFAVWAVRDGVELGDRLGLFQESLEQGLRNVDSLVGDAARDQRLDESELHEYLTRNLSYHLGPEELSGLYEFFERAFDQGLIDDVKPLRFVRSCDVPVDSVE